MIIILQNHCSTPPLLSNIGHTENEGGCKGAIPLPPKEVGEELLSYV